MENKDLVIKVTSSNTVESSEESMTVISWVDGNNGTTFEVLTNTKNGTMFTGITSNESFKEVLHGNLPKEIMDMFINAINNRTRERNFIRLNAQLEAGNITEEEFDNELDEHEDRYLITKKIHPTLEQLYLSVKASENILDINDMEDFSELFSFEEKSIQKYLKK